MTFKKVTVPQLKKMKQAGEKIAMLTAYDFPTAAIMNDIVDVILIGDSVGSNVLGMENELPVTMDIIMHHTKAVAKGANKPLIVADMPFLSYGITVEEGLRNAGILIKDGFAEAVKAEGAGQVCDLVRKATLLGIPFMGHLGLTPQSIHKMGGYKVQAKTEDEADKLLNDAKDLEAAGVFALVLECVPRDVAKKVTDCISIPTIGIGAGPDCDGQVLVYHDLLGLTDKHQPKHAKKYKDLRKIIREGISEYVEDVKKGRFPTDEQSFHS